MSDPSTENQTASVVSRIIAALVSGEADAVRALILADTAGIMAIPVIGQIWTAIVGFAVTRIIGYVGQQVSLGATKIIIDIQVKGEESSATQSFANLQMAEASGDPAAITKASADLDAAYASLFHYDGSYSPP